MTRRTGASRALHARALNLMPGGVSSPVRAFHAVGGEPLYFREGAGSRVTDADGNDYLDYVCSWGPLLFGHAPEAVIAAVNEASRSGTSFGAPTEREVELAELVCAMVPSIEMVRFVNSGGEATASAVRLARAATGRRRVIKCAGCYHGSHDALLVRSGSGIATLGIPSTAGVPESVAAETVVVEYNDSAGLEAAFGVFGDEIAGFILEPVAGNMGVVPPKPGYLQASREITRRHGALLIFDEVMTGFRLSAGGAQELFGVMPDITALGKIIGGGLPVGAYGGARSLMERVAPAGPMYQAGTLSGNPLAMAAGIATLREIVSRGAALYAGLEFESARLAAGIGAAARDAGIPCVVQRVGSMFTPFFTDSPVGGFADASRCDTARFARFFHAMLDAGVCLPPSQFEAGFVSAAHSRVDIDASIAAATGAMRVLA
jgi:glutamate-1-semialdehyde 2,1-aminomutase